jgi:hypothetical protein
MFPGALATLLATIASFLTVYALCRFAGAQSTAPAIAAAVFALGFGRRTVAHGARELLLAPVVLAFVALAALGVGRLLLAVPLAGAAVFVIGMFLAAYSRKYTGWIRQLGTLIALPLVTMLVVPAAPARAPGGPLVDLALGASAGVVSLVFATLAQAALRRLGHAAPAVARETAVAAAPLRAGLTVSTRIGDALYKGVLRLGGAIGGTLVAALTAHVWAPSGVAEAIVVFALLFAALVLRPINYAYWAAGTTLILALLARGDDGFNLLLLGTRLESILTGALCAVIAAWFVFPIRTVDVIRRRLADALKAFDDIIVHAHDDEARAAHAARYDHLMTELEGVAPPVRWHRRILVRSDASEHPAHWIDLAHEIRRSAGTVDHGRTAGEKERGRLRRAIGASRKAIGQHHDRAAEDRKPIGVALAELRDTLAGLRSRDG